MEGHLVSQPSPSQTTPTTKKPFFLSASRIDTFISCSALYAAKYISKIPDKGNDGSSRGSVCHQVLECLLKPKHEEAFRQVVLHDSCREVPVVWRLILLLARHYNVLDDENLGMIDSFILVALKHEFKGPKGTLETHGEKQFELKIDERGVRYNIRGAIDKTFVVKNGDDRKLQVVDYKASKIQHKGQKLTDNIQSQMYQLALRHLYPEITDREFKFLFVKFPKAPVQKQPSFTDSQLNAFEWRLHYLQEEMESFTADKALDHPASLDPDNQWLCGRHGVKKDGTAMWVCPAREPMDYWVLVDNGDIVASAFTKDGLQPKGAQKIEKRRYGGCPAWYNEKGQRRSFQ